MLLSQKTAPLFGVASQWYNRCGPDGSRQTPRWSSRPDRRLRRAPTYRACLVPRASRESSLSDANFGLLPPQRGVRMPAGWPITRGAWACLGHGARMREPMADPRAARQAFENRGETRFRPRPPDDRPWPQDPKAVPAAPWRAPFAGLGISPASYCRGASRARNMRISQKPEVPLNAPPTFTLPGERDRAEEGRRE